MEQLLEVVSKLTQVGDISVREGFISFSSESFWTSPQWLTPYLFGPFWTQVSFSEVVRSKISPEKH